MDIVQVFNVGSVGIIRDQPPHTLPPEAWSDGQNVRFRKAGASRMLGEEEVFGTPSVVPYFLLPAVSATETFWIYTSLLKAYVYEGGTHTNITRQTASVDVDYATVNPWDWTGTLLGGIPILNNKVDVPQYWSDYAPATKLVALPNWPSTLRAEVLRAFGRYLVALNITDNGTPFPHTIQWSNSSDPGSVPADWDITDATSDAGRIELTDIDGGPLKDGQMLGREMILYKANSTHALRFVGGNDIFASDLLLTNSGILSTRCVAPIKKGSQHLVLTESDVIVHSGQKSSQQSVIEDKDRDWLFANIDATAFPAAFVFENPFYNEAWVCFPSNGATQCDTVGIYNYDKGTWAFRDFEQAWASFGLIDSGGSGTWDSDSASWDSDTSPWNDSGLRGILLANAQRTLLQKLDVGDTLVGASPQARLERTGLAIIGRDRTGQPKVDYRVVKQVSRITPKLTGSGVVEIQVGAQDDFNDDVTWSDSYEFNIGTDSYIDLDPPVVGKLIAVKFTSNSEARWQLEGYDLEMALLGNL